MAKTKTKTKGKTKRAPGTNGEGLAALSAANLEQGGPPIELAIRAANEELLGRYTNVVFLSHSPREVIFNFLLQVGGERQLVSRIITSPAHAKELHTVLGRNLERYEKTYGAIEVEKPTKVGATVK